MSEREVFGERARSTHVPIGRLPSMPSPSTSQPRTTTTRARSIEVPFGTATAVFLNSRAGMSRQGAWGVVHKYGLIAGIGAEVDART